MKWSVILQMVHEILSCSTNRLTVGEMAPKFFFIHSNLEGKATPLSTGLRWNDDVPGHSGYFANEQLNVIKNLLFPKELRPGIQLRTC